MLKELHLNYLLDDIVPDLLLIDDPVRDNLYAFKEAFDDLRRTDPGDPHGEGLSSIMR